MGNREKDDRKKAKKEERTERKGTDIQMNGLLLNSSNSKYISYTYLEQFLRL